MFGRKKLTMEFYLVSTDHLCENLWFKDDEDFTVGMNYVAVLAFIMGVRILAFSLMSNHVHFVLECRYQVAERFINRYKQFYAKYYQRKYGVAHFLRRNHADIRALTIDGESLEKGIAYTLMNPVAANICQHPSGYRWCSADTLFRDRPAKGVRLGKLSYRHQIRLLRSNIHLNPDWIVGDDGYVQPDSYIAVKVVESLYRTPNRLTYFMNNSTKTKARLEKSEDGLPSFRDQVILAAVPDLCRSLFRKTRPDLLDDTEKAELIRQMRFRFSADLHQIARIVGISYSECVRLLDSF